MVRILAGGMALAFGGVMNDTVSIENSGIRRRNIFGKTATDLKEWRYFMTGNPGCACGGSCPSGKTGAGRPVFTTLSELFKIGPGPSSSHTMAPMAAGWNFLRLMNELPEELKSQATSLKIRLFGSLSATGKGHGTHRAVVAGLLGHEPETCPPDILDSLFTCSDETYPVPGFHFSLSEGSVVYDAVLHDYPCSNTLVISLYAGERVLLEREYYSVGGGFLHWKGERKSTRGMPVHLYSTMQELAAIIEKKGLTLQQVILENELAITGSTVARITAHLDAVIETMCAAVDAGLKTEGLLPGDLKLRRKAASVLQQALNLPDGPNRFIGKLAAYAFAAAEENAAGHRIVTAPTAGSAGVLPALIYHLRRERQSMPNLRNALMAAASIGYLVRHNASIAGAEVGCQGEIGVASAMGAALLAQIMRYPLETIQNSAEIALEHHLGMTCDPVGGYVQIPCIERNAMSAVKAYTAYLIASSLPPGMHRVGLDEVITAMAETGRDMNAKYKETALGGLALSVPQC